MRWKVRSISKNKTNGGALDLEDQKMEVMMMMTTVEVMMMTMTEMRIIDGRDDEEDDHDTYH